MRCYQYERARLLMRHLNLLCTIFQLYTVSPPGYYGMADEDGEEVRAGVVALRAYATA